LTDAEIAEHGIRFGGGAGCECCPPWIIDDNTEISFSTDEAREYANALLAAADKAEELS
jgi:hypothetical protein